MIGIKHNDGAGFFPLGRVNESAVVLASSRRLRMGEDAGFKIATTREAMTKLPFPIRIRLSFCIPSPYSRFWTCSRHFSSSFL